MLKDSTIVGLPDSIRQLYTPIQPTVQQSITGVVYQELLPALPLQQCIYCYWELKTSAPLSQQFKYTVVADGCIDIFFERNTPAQNFVMGFYNTHTEFLLAPSFHYIGIRFLPTMFPQLFQVHASTLRNTVQKLNFQLPAMSQFIASLTPDLTIQEIINSLDTYFLQRIARVDFNCDNRFYKAIANILENSGKMDIEKACNTGISQRQLRRIFDVYIGSTAKLFSQVVRFQSILRTKPSEQGLWKSQLSFDYGYYDQAHFIKEFKRFYGTTPNRALNEK